MFDSHCHLTDLADPDKSILSALSAGVRGMLCCGYDEASNAAVLALSGRWKGLPIALGLHPWYATQALDGLWPLLDTADLVAVGECGLDGKLAPQFPALGLQRDIFEAQLDYAQRRALPVVVHSRQAVSEVVACLSNYPRARGVLHAYSGSIEQIHALLDRGWMVGVAGAVTRPAAHRLHRLVRRLPESAVLLETDSPAIGLEGVLPEDVRPLHVIQIARAVAECRQEPLERVVKTTNSNAASLFGAAVLGPFAGLLAGQTDPD